MPSKLEASGQPDEDSLITQVAGPTKVAVCEGAGIIRIQPEYRRCCGPPSKVKHLENCSAQDSRKSSPGIPDTLGLPACLAGGCGGKSVLQCCSVSLRAVCRYCGQVL
jgi:hypothetical protein